MLFRSIVDLKQPGSSFDFLGFTFRFDRSLHGTGRYLNIVPSAKSLKRARSRIHDLTIRRIQLPVQEVIASVNRFLVGWSTCIKEPSTPCECLEARDSWRAGCGSRSATETIHPQGENEAKPNGKTVRPIRRGGADENGKPSDM